MAGKTVVKGASLDVSTFARDYSSEATTVEDILADVQAIGALDGSFSVYRAKVTWGVVSRDLIGEGKPFPLAKDYAAHIGVSAGMVTKYKRLARAYYVHNVRPDEDESLKPLWGDLYQRVNSLALTRKAIDGDEALTPDDVRALIAKDDAAPAKPSGGPDAPKELVAVVVDGETVWAPKAEEMKRPKESVTDLFAHLNDWCAFGEDSLREVLAKATALAAKAGTMLAEADAAKDAASGE